MRPMMLRGGLVGGGMLIRSVSRYGSVLCFHGLRLDDDPVDSVMNLTLGAFQRSIDLIRASAEIVPLTELHQRWSEGKSTRGLVAITFDDAYRSLLETADRWYTASPFPITIFVVTGSSTTGEAFWWDRLEALAGLLLPSERMQLEATCGMPLELRGQVDPVYGPLRRLRQWILGQHRGRAPSALSVELSRYESHHGRSTSQGPMRVEELRQMGRLGPVSFGVHTISHPVLPLLTPSEATDEIRGAWATIQEWGLPSRVPMLAVPFGLLDASLPAVSRECQMLGCLALDDRTLWRCDPAKAGGVIPRLSIVQGTTPSRLAYRLSGLRDLRRFSGFREMVHVPRGLRAW